MCVGLVTVEFVRSPNSQLFVPGVELLVNVAGAPSHTLEKDKSTVGSGFTITDAVCTSTQELLLVTVSTTVYVPAVE